ncbi:MAG: hypothetical protein DWH91_06355 [Planctomycetota bacterium]|nr:MAG: hypothetical protein DWH91_06355 [Planctomycetota bacterium]
MSEAQPKSDLDAPPVTVQRRLLLMIAGGVLTVCLMACCVCSGAMFYFRPRIEQSPEKAIALTKQVFRSITIPSRWEARGTIELNVFHQLNVRGAYYEHPKYESVLALIHVDSRWNSQASVREHIRETMIERGGGDEPMLIQERATREFTVRDSLLRFEFSTAKDLATDKTYRLVEGVVTGTTGDVLICLKIDADAWDEDEVAALLQSIQ